MKKTFVYDPNGRVVEEMVVLDDTDLRIKAAELASSHAQYLDPIPIQDKVYDFLKGQKTTPED
ncbi:MAG: hypothetical protein CVT94_13825 [Bacteroidetes bacterium HGW-Bacteroidetes-11]|jgi:hypothetical protein|nr:MAG: hypothetical protein CVT94_13825 [Bacteroidetes bacterium HGW-Bacteroidetes-11]